MNESPASDDRMMAAVAHFFGPLGATIVWATQKDRSHYVRFQALQALCFDFVALIVITALMFLVVGAISMGIFGSIYAVASEPSSEQAPSVIFFSAMALPFAGLACALPLSLVITVVRSIAAFSLISGRDFRYPVIGSWLEGFLAT